MRKILVIAPHPDDEAIGCGGTLLRHAAAGDAIRAVFLTSGEKGCRGRPEQETAALREAEAHAAAVVLGIGELEFWHQPDGLVQPDLPLVGRLVHLLADWRPAVLYVPHEDEMHPDHQAAARLVRRAREAAAPPHPEVLMYEVWTPMQHMDHVEDISDRIDAKLAAIRAHACQCEIMRFDEAIRGLNRYRGEMHSWPGGPYAEVFRKMLQ